MQIPSTHPLVQSILHMKRVETPKVDQNDNIRPKVSWMQEINFSNLSEKNSLF